MLETKGRLPIIIFVSVAPLEPYPSLFASGPKATWMRETFPDLIVYTYSGLPLTRFRRQLSALRELLRFSGAPPALLGYTVNVPKLLRLYGAVAKLARPSTPPKTIVGSVKARSAARLINLASRSVSRWERHVTSPLKERRQLRVTRSADHFTVHQASTMSNSLAIQLAVIRHLAKGEAIVGAVFTTASAYIDQQRLAAWVHLQEDSFVVGGSNPLADHNGVGHIFLSGFCQYFSWEALRTLADADDFDHSRLNDEAITAWLLSRGFTWSDPGIVWSLEELNDGRCPLCEDASRSVVRCTSHGSRHREAEIMQQLSHRHHGDV